MPLLNSCYYYFVNIVNVEASAYVATVCVAGSHKHLCGWVQTARFHIHNSYDKENIKNVVRTQAVIGISLFYLLRFQSSIDFFV